MFLLHNQPNAEVRNALKTYDDFSAALLAQRGITNAFTAEAFLNPSYDTQLHDPFLLTDMPRAAERLATAIRTGEHIAIWSDYDCDGIPGAVMFNDFLSAVGASFEIYIPHRHLEGYGMNVDGIMRLAERDVTLLVTIDSGTTDHEVIKRASELGMDVIVTDHHLPGETLPEAFAVVNPNAREYEPYPFKGLCGSGVAWKLICAVLSSDTTLREIFPEGKEKWLLDMVGLATIADLVPLVDENRVLSTYGLVVLRKSPRLGVQKLCQLMRINQQMLSEDDVAFMIAPRVNAASRLGDAYDALALFTTSDEVKAEMLAKKLEVINRKRKAEVGAVTRAARARLKERTVLPEVIVLGDPSWRPALLGLVANTLADEYERPVFLWGREGNLSLKGSVRSGNVIHALELMRATDTAFVTYGGHAAAGGFTVKNEEIFSLEKRLNEAFSMIRQEVRSGIPFEQQASAVLAPEEATVGLLAKLERFAPFGIDNPKPIFLFRNVFVQNISRFGKAKEHVKISLGLTVDAPVSVEAVAFFPRGSLEARVRNLVYGGNVTVLAHVERDKFSYTHPARLRLIDVRLV